MSSKRKRFSFQRREDSTTSFHCSVPRCTASARCNSMLSFFSFPLDEELRGKWVLNIRRDDLQITSHTRVCGRHFQPADVIQPSTQQERRRLKRGAVPLLFEWNNYSLNDLRDSVWERREFTEPPPDHDPEDLPMMDVPPDHDYCFSAQPRALDQVLKEKLELKAEIAALRRQMEERALKNKFGLERFAASDEDIKFYTGFESYSHLMSFWSQIEPATYGIVRATRAQSASLVDDAVPTSLQPIDQFFILLTCLSVGLVPEDLAHRFMVPKSVVTLIITTWANFLYTVLGALGIWLDEETVKRNMPEVFSDFADTHVILDIAELRCQAPDSLQPYSETFYTPHVAFKGLIGMAPHGPVMFVSPLCEGGIGDRELLVRSGLVSLLQPSMAIMVDKSLSAEDFVPCKVHDPTFQKRTQPKTQPVAKLRAHIERVKGRVLKHELFRTVVPLSLTGCINQLFAVACLLVNYQNGRLKPQSQSDC